jgi:hypothetical protein
MATYNEMLSGKFLRQKDSKSINESLNPDSKYCGCSYFDVEGGGGCFPDRPSPPNVRTASCLLVSQGLEAAAELTKTCSVLAAVEAMKRLPG